MAALKRGINLTMKTRVEIKRSYDRINKVRIENSILVKGLRKPEYHASGVVRRPDETPLTPVARAAVSLAGELVAR